MLGWLERVLDFFGGAGPVLLSIIGFLLAAPYVDRFVIRRKRITWRELYNSKLALAAPLEDGEASTATTQQRAVMELLDRMRMVVIRIHNSGSYDIEPGDFDEPLAFDFGDRVVWNARISEAADEDRKEELKRGLTFLPPKQPATNDHLSEVRSKLFERLRDNVLGRPGRRPDGAPELDPQWHQVRLDDLSLARREKFKLVVVLEDPAAAAAAGDRRRSEPRQSGKLDDGGLIKNEKKEPFLTLPRLTRALAAVLTVLLVLFLVFKPEPRDPGIACASGTLRIEGSSVYMPAVRSIADEYERACSDAEIGTEANGSIAGVRSVIDGGPGELIALSDGRSRYHQRLYSEQSAIVVFHVVVNGSVGVNTLSTDDLRKIHDGRYTDWNQITGARGKPGKSLPIRIVGRGQDSGTRLLFERNVLGTGEGGLSSDECRTRDRNPQAPIIRCERESNSEVVQQIAAVPGAIGYADVASTARARHTKDLRAVTIDGRAFDSSTAVDSGYPFWTVEYVYTKGRPDPDSLAGRFVAFLRDHARARALLSEAGFRPCDTSRGPLDLCNLR